MAGLAAFNFVIGYSRLGRVWWDYFCRIAGPWHPLIHSQSIRRSRCPGFRVLGFFVVLGYFSLIVQTIFTYFFGLIGPEKLGDTSRKILCMQEPTPTLAGFQKFDSSKL